MKSQKLYLAIGTLLAVTLLSTVPAKNALAVNGMTASPGVIAPGGTTDLTITLDAPATGTVLSWDVLEADGDECSATGLPAAVGAGITKTYPTDFVLNVAGGDGVCDTGDIGSYNAEALVKVSVGTMKIVSEFETSFFVLPESPIGAVAIIGSSLGALGAFVGLRRHRVQF
jgi:hypothetical protein